MTGVDYKEITPSLYFDKLELGKSKLVPVTSSNPSEQHMISCGHPPLDQRVEIVNRESARANDRAFGGARCDQRRGQPVEHGKRGE